MFAVADFDYVMGATVDFCRGLGLEPLIRVPIRNLSGDRLSPAVASRLTALVHHHHICAVIISTPPDTHKAYALWALEAGLHILMDKPITTRENAAFDRDAASKIYDDYCEIDSAHRALQTVKETVFLVHTPRRYNPAFQKVMSLVTDIRDEFGWPVTSLDSCHSDGQWRLPDEFVDVDHHGYNQGIGVVSHTAYHIIDIAVQMLWAGMLDSKRPDGIEVTSTFVLPRGHSRQMKAEDYRRTIEEYDAYAKYSDDEVYELSSHYGEIDAHIALSLWAGLDCVGHVALQALHNGFSQRGNPATTNYSNLYKGMGRLNHEYHFLHQGPIQSVQMLSFQSKSPQVVDGETDFMPGGTNHRDVHVYRNSNFIGGPALQSFTMDELMSCGPSTSSAQLVEKLVVEEFVRSLFEPLPLTSAFDSHWLAACVMSATYLSHARRFAGESPIVRIDLNARTI